MRGNRDELKAALSNFRRSAWGWECQGIYEEPAELFEQWRGGVIDEDAMRGWLALSHKVTNSGRTVGRVWVLSDPPTQYERWQLDVAGYYRAAGEHIQLISEADALAFDLPDCDFWVFDDELVAVLMFEDHVIVGADLITDPARVRQYLAHRRVATREAHDLPVPLRSA